MEESNSYFYFLKYILVTTFCFLESRKVSHYLYFLKSRIFGMYFYFLESSKVICF